VPTGALLALSKKKLHVPVDLNLNNKNTKFQGIGLGCSVPLAGIS
jgi:hypothetical protein